MHTVLDTICHIMHCEDCGKIFPAFRGGQPPGTVSHFAKTSGTSDSQQLEDFITQLCVQAGETLDVLHL